MKIEFPDLEIEITDAGVLYIHDKLRGVTIVRVCGLNRLRKPMTDGEQPTQVDVTITDCDVLASRSQRI